MITNGQNFYEILEINEDATLQDVERAYIEAKETYSPTSTALYSMFSPEEAQELHRLIELAYTTLTNQDLRKKYDQQIQAGSTNTEIAEKSPLFINSPTVEKAQVDISKGLLIKDFSEDSSVEEKIKSLSDCSGSFLQKVRKYKNISLDEISEFSKVSKTNILAVEEEDFTNLPARVFVRGFVMQICKLLGIEPATFAKEYLKSFDEFKKK